MRPLDEFAALRRNRAQIQAVGVVNDRDKQTVFGRNCQPDMDVVVEDDARVP